MKLTDFFFDVSNGLILSNWVGGQAHKLRGLISVVETEFSRTWQHRQFDLPETLIVGKFNHFCRRVIKLIDLFSTIHQFSAFLKHSVEGMDDCISMFEKIVAFSERKHKSDLLEYEKDQFDRDLVEVNVKISDLEGVVQQSIDESFTNTRSIENALLLLQRFRTVLQRESSKQDLDSKLNVIFHNYAEELQDGLKLYEKQKCKPPIPRNLPPVAGNIMWSRQLSDWTGISESLAVNIGTQKSTITVRDSESLNGFPEGCAGGSPTLSPAEVQTRVEADFCCVKTKALVQAQTQTQAQAQIPAQAHVKRQQKTNIGYTPPPSPTSPSSSSSCSSSSCSSPSWQQWRTAAMVLSSGALQQRCAEAVVCCSNGGAR